MKKVVEMKKILATGLVVAALMLGGGTSAFADTATNPTAQSSTPSPQSLCSGSLIVYHSSTGAGAFSQASGPNSAVTGSAGVTLAISTSTSYTVSGSITATAGVSVSNVVATVKADVGVTIGQSKTGTTTNSGSWTVPSSYNIGRLAIGALKYSGSVTKYLENSNCVLIQQGSPATFNAPRNEWSFQASKVS